jgi:hypothetical protein
MARSTKTVPQAYPRIDDDSRKDYGCLDESALAPHPGKLAIGKLKSLIRDAIRNANNKSSREILYIQAGSAVFPILARLRLTSTRQSSFVTDRKVC